MATTVRCKGALTALATVALFCLAVSAAQAQQTADTSKGSFLLTIFLRHDQSKTLDQINEHLKASGYYKKFPPEGIEVVSWYVMMGIGQVVDAARACRALARGQPGHRRKCLGRL